MGREKDPLLSRRRLIQRFLWPWEIPISSERSPEGCGQKKSPGCSNVLVKGQFPIDAMSMYRNIFRTETAAPEIFRGGHILFACQRRNQNAHFSAI